MVTKTAYEHGARILKPSTGPDPSDDFSQDAAENKKPPLGIGLAEKVSSSPPRDTGEVPVGNPTAETASTGTTDQRPRWEGPPENRPRGYLPATDDPSRARDAAGENLRDPDRSHLGDAVNTKRSSAMDHSKHVRLTSDELTPSTIEGATVYGAEDSKVGTVSHMHGTGAGSRVVIDVGGFLGIGAKPVAVSAGELDFMRDEAGEVHAVTTWTKERLKAMPEHPH